ncbi:GIY-YIG nuclease family protein [Dehalococcoides sp. THU3]|uniref:GIY-YIG nuclease family protein n=1 Tax=Dehalococcoides TaxID=61434 RepID=UPI003218673D
MTVRGKSINLFLMDGTASGRIKCTLANWTGVAYKIPRTELDKCKERDDLKQSGVYFLFGTSDQTGENIVYIGQAGARKNGEGILYRLQEHKRNPDKDYWTEAVVFTTSNNSFGPTEISYLENRFCNLAAEAKRYIVKNGNDPTSGNITEEKESELEEFIDYSKIVMGTYGHKIFEPLTVNKEYNDPLSKTCENKELLLRLKRKSRKSGQVIEANCRQTNEGFVVLKGSHIETIDSESIPPGIKESRQKASIDANGILQEDVLFRSPSYAAAFVIGGHVNGLTAWETIDGKTLKDIEGEISDQ